jgi:hypothetical protein
MGVRNAGTARKIGLSNGFLTYSIIPTPITRELPMSPLNN